MGPLLYLLKPGNLDDISRFRVDVVKLAKHRDFLEVTALTKRPEKRRVLLEQLAQFPILLPFVYSFHQEFHFLTVGCRPKAVKVLEDVAAVL